jgi:hypothetical protein
MLATILTINKYTREYEFMYGVVLWSDDFDKKAVFWCEDEGDLAYFSGSQDSTVSTFDAGDLVEFDISRDSKLRTATNPRIVQEKLDIQLPAKLLAEAPCTNPAAKPPARQSAEIVDFSSRRSNYVDEFRAEFA